MEEIKNFISTKLAQSFHTKTWTTPQEKMDRIRLIAPVIAATLHAIQVVVFCALGFNRLAWASVFSVSLFFFIIYLVKVGYSRLGMYLIYLEVVVHSTALTLILGLGTGYLFYYFSLAAGAFVVFSHREVCDRVACLVFAMVAAPVMIGLANYTGPLMEISPRLVEFFFFMNLLGTLFGLVGIVWYFAWVSSIFEEAIESERERSEALLLNVLPAPIAKRLKEVDESIVDHYGKVSVLFADIVGFTPLASRLEVHDLIDMLNHIFSAFDQLADEHELEKIKTIGDAYMVAGGIPLPRENHIESMAEMAFAMRDKVREYAREKEIDLDIRIGIHLGEVVAGVIGVRKFSYDLWGNTVNVASRMESHGEAGKIQVSEAVQEELADRYQFEERGPIEIKGKGRAVTWFIEPKG